MVKKIKSTLTSSEKKELKNALLEYINKYEYMQEKLIELKNEND